LGLKHLIRNHLNGPNLEVSHGQLRSQPQIIIINGSLLDVLNRNLWHARLSGWNVTEFRN